MTLSAPDLSRQIALIMREDRGRLLSALIRTLGSFDLAEDALQDASERALVHWARSGLPDRPDAWLLQVARRAAIDRIRKNQRHRSLAPEINRLMEEDEEDRARDTGRTSEVDLHLLPPGAGGKDARCPDFADRWRVVDAGNRAGVC